MKQRLTHLARIAALAAATTLCAAGAQAAAIIKNPLPTFDIPGLTGFATTGAMMTGLQVTAVFSGGLTQTLAWATTGVDSGGVSGAGWSLNAAGDTFNSNAWNFAMSSNLGALQRLVLDGSSALTLFDTSDPDQGTPGSASGADFAIDNALLDAAAIATYSNMVTVGGAAAVGDLFQTLTITFAAGGLLPTGNFRFTQDTDNDARFGVPEPTSLALVGLALAGLGAARRRRV